MVCTQCMRAGCPVNLLQMQVSPSVVLRGTRLWNKPGDLRSPYLSQNATRMERLPRSLLPQIYFPSCFSPFNSVLLSTSPLHIIQGISFTSLTEFFDCTHSDILTKWWWWWWWFTFLPMQVQCHTLTGYCWCVTSDGKPVSGSSVHNRTPVCSGTGGNQPGNLWMKCLEFFKRILKCLSRTRLPAQLASDLP